MFNYIKNKGKYSYYIDGRNRMWQNKFNTNIKPITKQWREKKIRC